MTKNLSAFLLGSALLLQGCMTAGYEGQVGNIISGDQIGDRREALRSVRILENSTSGYDSLGSVSVRRCHRNFSQEAPNLEAITADLKVAAFAAGGDAISNISTKRIEGLLANCWYVLEGTANVWMR